MRRIFSQKNELVEKIKTVTQRYKFQLKGKKITTEMDLAKFLYEANVIIGRLDEDNEIRRIYFIDEPNLITKLGNGSYRFEIHPAYRWAIDMLHRDDLLDGIDIESLYGNQNINDCFEIRNSKGMI